MSKLNRVDLFSDGDFKLMIGASFGEDKLNYMAMACNAKAKAAERKLLDSVAGKLSFGFIVAMNEYGLVTYDNTKTFMLFIKNNGEYIAAGIQQSVHTLVDFYMIKDYGERFLYSGLEQDYINNNAKDDDRGDN